MALPAGFTRPFAGVVTHWVWSLKPGALPWVVDCESTHQLILHTHTHVHAHAHAHAYVHIHAYEVYVHMLQMCTCTMCAQGHTKHVDTHTIRTTTHWCCALGPESAALPFTRLLPRGPQDVLPDWPCAHGAVGSGVAKRTGTEGMPPVSLVNPSPGVFDES